MGNAGNLKSTRAGVLSHPDASHLVFLCLSPVLFHFQSKIFTRTPTIYLDFKLKQGAKHAQPIPKGKANYSQ